MRHPGHDTATPRLVMGLIVMGIGLMLTLDNFGVLDSRRFWQLWPLILVALGLARLSHWARTGGRPDGVGLFAVGLALLLLNLHIIQFRHLVPLFLLGMGAVIFLKAFLRERAPQDGSDTGGQALIDAFVVMGGAKRASSSPDFKGGNAFALMGGVEIDLRQASIETDAAVLDIFAMMGGIEIRVPESWTVEIRANALLGGFEDKTRRPPDERRRLVITGFAIMGGVEVKN
jgi:LiaF transmembrane domain/Cell wall-active antibiotics response LiaF, C-terminal